MCSSIVVIFLLIWARQEPVQLRLHNLVWSQRLTIIACLTLLVSLMTAVYITVAPTTPSLAYAVIAIGISTPALFFIISWLGRPVVTSLCHDEGGDREGNLDTEHSANSVRSSHRTLPPNPVAALFRRGATLLQPFPPIAVFSAMSPEELAAAKAQADAAAAAKAKADADAAAKAAADAHAKARADAEADALYAAQERGQLHAQAIAVSNIKTMVPFVLEQTSDNFSRWRNYFLNVLGKYDLTDLVLSDEDFSSDPHWHRMDCTVKSWLYSTVAPDLVEIVSTASPTSRSIWLGLLEQFVGNKERRALILDAEFRNFEQGDLSISEYCRKLKSMADALADLGEPVPDRTLVLNVLRGLNEKFAHMASLITHRDRMPTFIQLRADLRVEETIIKTRRSSSTALVAGSTPTSGQAPRPPAPTPPQQPGGSNHSAQASNPAHNTGYGRGGQGRGRNRRQRPNNGQGGQGAQGGGPTGAQGGGQAAFQPGWNPYTGTFTMWAGPRAPGVMGPRPQSAPVPQQPPQQAFTASHAGPAQQPMLQFGPAQYGLPPHFGGLPQYTPPVYPPMVWDQNQLAQSFNTMQLQPPPTNEWCFDSGASSHMASSSAPGSSIPSAHLRPLLSQPSPVMLPFGIVVSAISPSYEHLRVFGCKCYPNLSATAPHKLAPRSTLCVFLGYPSDHKGYRCLDLTTNRIILSRHVVFDEAPRSLVVSTEITLLPLMDPFLRPLPAGPLVPTRHPRIPCLDCADLLLDFPLSRHMLQAAASRGPHPSTPSSYAPTATDGSSPRSPLAGSPSAVSPAQGASALPAGRSPLPLSPATDGSLPGTPQPAVSPCPALPCALQPPEAKQTYRGALADPNWRDAMNAEFTALLENHTWDLVPPPPGPHLALVKRVLRYIKGTLDFGLQIHRSPSSDLVAYSDADWAGCPDTLLHVPTTSQYADIFTKGLPSSIFVEFRSSLNEVLPPCPTRSYQISNYLYQWVVQHD
ncbi:hypothetical protein HU200_034511 [Digitaria exilis]|uniref:Retroviral polymerase SH3-like domain-containing protein n=1 Tax=Digitaria exilis TaxID=1010633 RepID=A0A835EMJ2_9POAL|nr:hypothetical protein HU200_034511 [Digitaria exilis]